MGAWPPCSTPELKLGPVAEREPPGPGQPLRLLFMGRIMTYKALPLFLDTVDILRSKGIAVEIGVFGEGPLGHCAGRLAAMQAEVVNRWLSAAELGDLLPRFHALVLSHVEASQSGMAAVALGAGMPVVATPTGGLIEQIEHERTGILARSADAPALAAAVQTLAYDPALYRKLCKTIRESGNERSMARFVDGCVALAVDAANSAVR